MEAAVLERTEESPDVVRLRFDLDLSDLPPAAHVKLRLGREDRPYTVLDGGLVVKSYGPGSFAQLGCYAWTFSAYAFYVYLHLRVAGILRIRQSTRICWNSSKHGKIRKQLIQH